MASHGWLSRRPLRFREEVIQRSRLQSFAAGESLYNAGDGPAGMFGLISGQMLIRVPPADTIISIASPGQWAGDATCFLREPRWVSITAGSALHALHLSQADFDTMIRDAENCRHFAINTAESLAEAITVVTNLTQPDSEVRVAQRLLTFMGLHHEARFRALAMSQADLRDHVRPVAPDAQQGAFGAGGTRHHRAQLPPDRDHRCRGPAGPCHQRRACLAVMPTAAFDESRH